MSKTAPDKGFELCWHEYQAISLRASVLLAYHHWSEEQVAAAQALGAVCVNGVVEYGDIELQPGDNISLLLPDHQEEAVDTGWKILWQHQELTAVHKPAPLPVSRTTRNLFNTLISLFRRATVHKDAHLLHRLDAETSGIILLANYAHADKKWKKKLERLIERKVYHALVYGVPGWQEAKWERRSWQGYECQTFLAEKTDSAIRSQMHVVAEDETDTVKSPKLATTRFRVLKTFNGYSLIECELLSGRKHQIRAQLAHLGYPIIGDKIYSHNGRFYLKRLQQDLSADDYAQLGAEHHLLHAFELQLNTATGDQRDEVVIYDKDYPKAWLPYLQGASF